jgi:membrane-bound serine protease (ClpP class)
MLACPINAMAPGTNIGAAHPVGVSGAIESEKVTNDAAAFIVSLANKWGRNADWAEKAVRDAISAPAEQAVQLGVVDYIASDARAALAIGPCAASSPKPTTGALADPNYQLSLCGSDFVPFKMSLSESLFHSFADPNVAFLLLNIGFIALIVWVIHPAFHVSLAVGIVATVIGLAILETLPVRLVGVVLLLVAAVLFVLDVKAKAHGILTTAGIAMLILGGLLLFNPTVPSARVSRPLIIGVAVAMGLATFSILRSILAAKGAPVRTGIEALQGSTGLAETALAPRGTARVQHQTWTAETTGEPLPAGTPIRVVAVRGVTLLVERDSAQMAPATGGPNEEGMVR